MFDIGGAIKGVGAIVGGLDELFTTDEELSIQETKRRGMELKEKLAEVSIALKALEIDKVEAGSPHWFVAAARPAMKWLVVVGIAWSVILVPVINSLITFVLTILTAFGVDIGMIDGRLWLEPVDWEKLVALGLTGTGLYGLRSYEKGKGVARDNLSHSPKPEPPAPAGDKWS